MRFYRLILLAMLAASLAQPGGSRASTQGSDELFWVPSFEQALSMANHTGRPIFLMFYTLVGKGCATYTGDAKTVL